MKNHSQSPNQTTKRIVTWLVTLLALAGSALAEAATCTFTAASGSWDTAANWSCGSVPTVNDNVSVTGNKTVTLGVSNYSIQSIVLEGTLTGAGSGSTTLGITNPTGTLTQTGPMTFQAMTVNLTPPRGPTLITIGTPLNIDNAIFNTLGGGGNWYYAPNINLINSAQFNNGASLQPIGGYTPTITSDATSAFNNIGGGVAVNGTTLTISGMFAMTNSAGLIADNGGTITLASPSLFSIDASSFITGGGTTAGIIATTGNQDLTLADGSLNAPLTFNLGTGTLFKNGGVTDTTDYSATPIKPATIAVNGKFNQSAGTIRTRFSISNYGKIVVTQSSTVGASVNIVIDHDSAYFGSNGAIFDIVQTSAMQTGAGGSVSPPGGYTYSNTVFQTLSGALRLTQTAGPSNCTFTGVVSNAWNDQANWSNCNMGTPGQYDRANISNKTVTLGSSESFTVGDLILNGATIQGVDSINSTLTVNNAGSAWGTNPNTLQNIGVTLNSADTIPASSAPLTINGAKLQIPSGIIQLAALSVTNVGSVVIGSGATYQANGDITLDSNTSSLTVNSLGGQLELNADVNITAPLGSAINLNGELKLANRTATFTTDSINRLNIASGAYLSGTGGTITAVSGTLSFPGSGGGGLISPSDVTPKGGSPFTEVSGNITFNIPLVDNSGARFNVGGTNAIGTITINGNYTQREGGKVRFELDGTSPSQYDRFVVSGNIDMNYIDVASVSKVEVAWPGANSGYVPSIGNMFDLIQFGALTGSIADAAAYNLGLVLSFTETAPIFRATVASAAGALVPTPTALSMTTNTPVGWTSAGFVTLTNPTANPLVFSVAPMFTGDFNLYSTSGNTTTSANCLLQVEANGSCTYGVRFIPSTTGMLTGSMYFTAGGTPVTVPLDGVGITAIPLPTMTPDPTTFTSVPIGSIASTPVTVNNPSGGVALVLSPTARTIYGTDSTNFAVTSDSCGTTTVMPGSTCSMALSFSPATPTGAKTANLGYKLSPAGASYESSYWADYPIPLQGTATAATGPIVAVSGSTTFPNTMAGASSGVQTITITNTGVSVLNISSITHSSASIYPDTTTGPAPNASHWCGFGSSATGAPLTGSPISIAPMATCQLNLVFKPSIAGASSATINIISNAPSSPNIINLSGTGIAGVPPAITSAAPPSGTVGAAYTHTFTASGTPASAWSIVTGTMPPGLTLAPATGVLSGTPTASGMYTFAVQAANGTAPNAQLGYTVSIAAVAPTMAVAVSPTSVAPATNATVTLTLATTAAASQLISGGTVNMPTGLVIQAVPAPTNTCGTFVNIITGGVGISFGMGSVPAMGSCTISFAVRSAVSSPYVINVLAGSLNAGGANTNTSSATLVVLPPVAPGITVSPTSLVFGPVNINNSSVPKRITVTSSGQLPLVISALQSLGDFAYISDCPLSPASLPVNATCNIDITYNPLSAGTATAPTYISTNAPISPTIILMTGDGTNLPQSNIAVSPTSLAFGNQAVGSTSMTQSVIVTNSGSANLNLNGVTINGAGLQRVSVPAVTTPPITVPSCTNVVTIGGSCHISVVFAPSTTGAVSNGNITINHNVTVRSIANPLTVAITATGTPQPLPIIGLSGSLIFTDQMVGTASARQNFVITNSGTAPLNLQTIRVNPTNTTTLATDFTVTGTCPPVVAPTASCTLTVAFTPQLSTTVTPPNKNAKLEVFSDASNAVANMGVSSITLAGTAMPLPTPIARLSATTLGFGNVIFGSTAPTQQVTLTNIGNQALTLSGISFLGNSDFGQTNTCGMTLAPNAICTITVSFAPHAIGARSSTLNVTSNARSSPDKVLINGIGCRYFSPAAARFFLTSC